MKGFDIVGDSNVQAAEKVLKERKNALINHICEMDDPAATFQKLLSMLIASCVSSSGLSSEHWSQIQDRAMALRRITGTSEIRTEEYKSWGNKLWSLAKALNQSENYRNRAIAAVVDNAIAEAVVANEDAYKGGQIDDTCRD